MADTEILLRSLAYGFSSKDICLVEQTEGDADAS
jgi:hypothetical protein